MATSLNFPEIGGVAEGAITSRLGTLSGTCGPTEFVVRFLVVSILSALVLLAGCSTRSKKLGGGSIADTLIYDVLAQDRDPDYYYTLVKNNHETRRDRGAYLSTQDPFLVDKVVDAIQKLGDVQYSRLEGQAQVVVLLGEVMADDPSSMAQTHAANTLTKLAIKMPTYEAPATGLTEERGDMFLGLVREMDGLFGEDGTPRDAGSIPRATQIVTTIGNADIKRAKLARDALRPFTTRDYLIDATDPELRRALDTALVKRMRRSIELSLHEALEAPSDHVRRESVLGIKLLGDASAMEAVLARMEVEHDWQVRAEAVEYLGKMGTGEGVATLLPILDDEDPTLRHKSRQALTRIAGRDYGRRRATWARWAEARYPQLSGQLGEDDESEEPEANRPPEREPERGPRPTAPPSPVPGPGSPDNEPLPALDEPVPIPGRAPPVADGTVPLPGPGVPLGEGSGHGSVVPPPAGTAVPGPGAAFPIRGPAGVTANPSPSHPSAIPPRSYGAPPGLIPMGRSARTNSPRSQFPPQLVAPQGPTRGPIPVAPAPGSAIPARTAPNTPALPNTPAPPGTTSPSNPLPSSSDTPSTTVLPPPLPPLDLGGD